MEINGVKKYYYEPDRILGTGQYATVYKGYSIAKYGKQKEYAIRKLKKPYQWDDDRKKEQMQMEVNIMNKLDDLSNSKVFERTINARYICKCYDVLEDNNYLYFVLEYCFGGDLELYLHD